MRGNFTVDSEGLPQRARCRPEMEPRTRPRKDRAVSLLWILIASTFGVALGAGIALSVFEWLIRKLKAGR